MTTVKIPTDAPVAGATVPAFTAKVHWIKKQLTVSIQLHNIPDKHISLEVTTTHFKLNTLSYTKKLQLNFRYPEKIKVDENDVEADFSHGVLTVILKIQQILNTESGKLMAFKGKSTPLQASKPTKTQAQPISYRALAAQLDLSSSSEDESFSDPGDVDSSDSSSEEAPKRSAKASTKGKSHKSMDVSSDASEAEEKEEVETPKKSEKKTKKSFASKESSLKLLDEVHQKEEAKRSAKLTHEAEKEAYLTEKAAKKQSEKDAKKAIKDSKVKALVAAHKATSSPKEESKPAKKRKVQFDEEEEAAPVAKKPRRK